MKKRKVKSKKQKLKEKLEKLCKEYIRKRDKMTCQWCGHLVEGSNCHVSHVIPKSHGNVLRFDPLNLKVLCMHCHLHVWHKNPIEAAAWFMAKFPERWVYLQSKKEDIVKFTEQDYEDKIANIKELL